jgi:hypothetical protein
MSKGNKELKIANYIRDLCKGRTEEKLLEAEETFREYLLIVKEICDRMEREGKELEDFDEVELE